MQPVRCEQTRFKNKNGTQKAFSDCKILLTIRLQKLCDFSSVESPGDLVYCNQRQTIRCCFVNEKCMEWTQFQNTAFGMAKRYLEDKRGFLKGEVRTVGYKSCHHIDSSDVSRCAKDCKKLNKTDFARDCRKNGGLFKCCIRRDRRYCHECR